MRKYTKKEDYFESIDSKDKAYILGFIFADGHNARRVGTKMVDGHRVKQNYALKFGIQLQDKYILEFIASELYIGQKPVLYERVDLNKVTLEISSKKISDDLLKLGVTSNKTKTCEFPNIPNEYHLDFIRGYFDGDGSVGVYEYPYQKVYNFNILGTKEFLTKTKEILEKKCRVKLRLREKPEDNIWVLYSRSQKIIKKIYKKLYFKVESSFCLTRKKEKMALI